MSDPETQAVYGAKAQDYAKMFVALEPDRLLKRFINAVAQGGAMGGSVLDLGCGPAHASAFMRAAGLKPDPVDAAPEMVALANETHDINARLLRFDEISGRDIYDGIWANFSLLHARRDELPLHLSALSRALRPGGVFHIAMKLGTGEKRDGLGRFYTYYSHSELTALLQDAGLSVSEIDLGSDKGLTGEIEPWVVLFAHG